jgi:hypothetical protein
MGRIAIVLVVLLMGAYLCAEKQATRESSAQTLIQVFRRSVRGGLLFCP